MSKKSAKVHPLTKEGMKAIREEMDFSLRDLAAIEKLKIKLSGEEKQIKDGFED